MLLGSIKKLQYMIGDITILNELFADIPKGSCIAIVGPNGAGKSTLLSLIAGEIKPTSGSIDWIGNKPSITYFKQEQMEEGIVDWGPPEMAIYRSKWDVLNGVDYDFASGGERMKLRLSSALAEGSELILLDEPTNHLDQESQHDLVRIIRENSATCMIVSHDRHFIDQTADMIFEISHQQITVYEGNYSSYQKKKRKNLEIQQAHYEEQQRKITNVEKQIAQLENWSAKAHGNKDADKVYARKKAKKKNIQIRSKRNRLETELEKRRIDKPVEEQDVSFEVKGNRKKGHRVLELKNVRKAFEEHQLFEHVSFTVQAGDRIACIGANGSGKSTLFQMILGHESYDGELWLTKGMTIGYMSQHIIDLPSDQTLSEFFHTETFDEQGRVRIELSNLGFDEAHWNTPIRDLSQGERVKVKLMEFIRKGTDILLLDEPTNHLDLPSREQLENTLATFPGTLIFASHDKYFTKNMGTSLLVFEDKKIQKAPMTLEEWQERQSHPNAQNIDNDEERLRIETELQAVLGELSLIHEDDPSYHQLDQTFKELSNKLKKIT